MSTDKNARLTPYSREELVRCVLQEGTTVKDAAAAFGVSKTTAHGWEPVCGPGEEEEPANLVYGELGQVFLNGDGHTSCLGSHQRI